MGAGECQVWSPISVPSPGPPPVPPALAIVQHDLRAACGWYEAIAALHALAGRSADSAAGLVRRSAVARVCAPDRPCSVL